MTRGKFGIAVIAATTLLLTASPAMAVVDSAQISTATKKKKTSKKKAAPIYWATLSDGSRAQCTIVGTNGGNKIQGTPGNDVICGLGGNDKIYGNGGNDIIDAGAGNDLVVGGDGNDLIDGGAGNDKLSGAIGSDVLFGAAGNDIQFGESGMDEIIGGAGNDKLLGGDSDDFVSGEVGNDTVSGENGNDELSGGAGKDVITGGSGMNACSTDDKDKQATQCYFDNSNPNLEDVWTEPSIVDTSIGPQTVNVYIRLSDETGGFSIFNMWGSQLNINLQRLEVNSDGSESIKWENNQNLNGSGTFASCERVNDFKRLNPLMGFWGLNGCRIEGGKLDPVIRFTFNLPQYSKAGRYVISNISFADAVQNRVSYSYKNTKCGNNCSLGLINPEPIYWNDRISAEKGSFLQVGEGDTEAPTINSIEYPTSVNLSGGSQYVNAIVRGSDNVGFPDAISSQVVNLNFRHIDFFNSGGGQNISLYGSASGISCSSLSQWQQNMGCQESPGVFIIKIRIPSTLLNGQYQLIGLTMSDRIGNTSSYVYNCSGCPDTVKNLITPGFITVTGSTSSTDSSPPSLKGLSVSPGSINAIEYAQTVYAFIDVEEIGGFGEGGNITATFSIKDPDGSIRTSYTGGASIIMGAGGAVIGFQPCSEVDRQKRDSLANTGNITYEMGCLNSQSGNQYQFRVPIQVPAHAKNGYFFLSYIGISEGQNYSSYVSNQMPINGGALILEDVLGGGRGFNQG